MTTALLWLAAGLAAVAWAVRRYGFRWEWLPMYALMLLGGPLSVVCMCIVIYTHDNRRPL